MEEACSTGDKDFCLEVVSGELQLKVGSLYYKQVQTHIFVADAEYCDFILWTLKDCTVLHLTHSSGIMFLQRHSNVLSLCVSLNL